MRGEKRLIKKINMLPKWEKTPLSHVNLSSEIDRYAYTNALSKSSPATKLFFAISLLLISVMSPTPIVPIIVFLTSTIMLVYFAKIPYRFYLKMLGYPMIIIAVTCMIIAFFFGYQEPLAEINLLGLRWTVFNDGVNLGFNTFFRVAGGVLKPLFLLLHHPPHK